LDERGPSLMLLSNPGFVPEMDLGAVEAERCGEGRAVGAGRWRRGTATLPLPASSPLPALSSLPRRGDAVLQSQQLCPYIVKGN